MVINDPLVVQQNEIVQNYDNDADDEKSERNKLDETVSYLNNLDQ